MQGFVSDVAHTLAAHPKATAAGISAVILIAIIRAVIAGSYRFR
jgi:hypothetical protein